MGRNLSCPLSVVLLTSNVFRGECFHGQNNGFKGHARHNASTQGTALEKKNNAVACPVRTSGGHRFRKSCGRTNACEFTIASYNIHKCIGNDGVFDPLRIKNVILQLDADIVVLQEADARFGEREGLLDLDYLHLMGNYRSIFSPGRTSRSHGWHGNVVLYRNSIVNHVHELKLPGLEPRGALIVDFGIGKSSFRLLAVHLGLLRRSRRKQVEAIIEAADPHPQRHVIV